MTTALGFGADITAALPELRAQAESLMTLTVTAYSPNGFTDDPNTGLPVPQFATVGTSAAKLQGTSSSSRDTPTRYVRIGEVDRPVLESGLHLPISAFVASGVLAIVASEQRGVAWEFEVTAAPSPVDPSLVGRRYMVASIPAKSFATARRLDVVEV